MRCDYTCMAVCVCGGKMRLCVKLREKLAVGELRGQRSGICGMRGTRSWFHRMVDVGRHLLGSCCP